MQILAMMMKTTLGGLKTNMKPLPWVKIHGITSEFAGPVQEHAPWGPAAGPP